MVRYIDAEALMDDLLLYAEANEGTYHAEGFKNAITVVEDQPTADVRENVHAHWEEADKYGNRKCSNCKSIEHVPTLMGKPIVWDFCPNCGARMDERSDDD